MRHLIYGLRAPGSSEIRYVGRSSIGLARPRGHFYTAWKCEESGEWHSNLYVHNWIRSLGRESRFEVEVLEEFAPTENVNELLNAAEIKWIAFLRSRGDRLTNATEGGMGMLGFQHSDESKRLIAEASRNQKWTAERCEKISRALTGKSGRGNGGYRHTEETKKLLAEQQLGSKRPDQSGDKHWTARRESDPFLKKPGVKGTRVVCENDGREFDSGIEAARFYGVSGSVVSRALEGCNNRKGLRFKRLEP